MMELEHKLTEDQCNRLAIGVMDKLAEKYSDQYGPMPAMDLNPNILEHHTLRHALLRTAYMLGAMQTATECAQICAGFVDAKEQTRASIAAAKAIKKGNTREIIDRLSHEGAMSLHNSALQRCEAAIKARFGLDAEK